MTGANSGLGLEASRHFVRLGAAKVILACRSEDKGEAARKDIERSTGRHGAVEVWPLDLTSFNSVKGFCRRAQGLERLDVLILNAGVAVPEFAAADGGYETQIAVNVISTFLMALMVLPKLRETAGRFGVQPHVVCVSSDGHHFVRPRLPIRRDPNPWQEMADNNRPASTSAPNRTSSRHSRTPAPCPTTDTTPPSCSWS